MKPRGDRCVSTHVLGSCCARVVQSLRKSRPIEHLESTAPRTCIITLQNQTTAIGCIGTSRVSECNTASGVSKTNGVQPNRTKSCRVLTLDVSTHCEPTRNTQRTSNVDIGRKGRRSRDTHRSQNADVAGKQGYPRHTQVVVKCRVGCHLKGVAQQDRIAHAQRIGQNHGTRHVQDRSHIHASGKTSGSADIQLMRCRKGPLRIVDSYLSADGLKSSAHRNQCRLVSRGICEV